MDRGAIKRRSLIPRLLHLSVQAAASWFKENADVNGSPSHDDGEEHSSSELTALLEQYSATLGQPFREAARAIAAASEEDQKPLEVGSPTRTNSPPPPPPLLNIEEREGDFFRVFPQGDGSFSGPFRLSPGTDEISNSVGAGSGFGRAQLVDLRRLPQRAESRPPPSLSPGRTWRRDDVDHR